MMTSAHSLFVRKREREREREGREKGGWRKFHNEGAS
jgi:hypothetical protein